METKCPRARKVEEKNRGKIVRTYWKCKTICSICRGEAKVAVCPGCDGFGLRVGGDKCINCGATGKVPASRALQGALA